MNYNLANRGIFGNYQQALFPDIYSLRLPPHPPPEAFMKTKQTTKRKVSKYGAAKKKNKRKYSTKSKSKKSTQRQRVRSRVKKSRTSLR